MKAKDALSDAIHLSPHPRTEITVKGVKFDVTLPYAEGHVLNEQEAKALNQIRNENIRNAFARRIKWKIGEQIPEHDLLRLRAEFLQFDKEYAFGTGSYADPVRSEAKRIANSLVLEHLQKESVPVDTIPKDVIQKRISDLMNNPDVLVEARRRVETARRIAGDALEMLSRAEGVA
jgi:hypothetical protein